MMDSYKKASVAAAKYRKWFHEESTEEERRAFTDETAPLTEGLAKGRKLLRAAEEAIAHHNK